MELEFWVTICMDNGTSGDVSVTLDISKKEYRLLKKCCEEYEEIHEYEDLKPLYDRIVTVVKEECANCESENANDIDMDDVFYCVQMPDEIYDEVNG